MCKLLKFNQYDEYDDLSNDIMLLIYLLFSSFPCYPNIQLLPQAISHHFTLVRPKTFSLHQATEFSLIHN